MLIERHPHIHVTIAIWGQILEEELQAASFYALRDSYPTNVTVMKGLGPLFPFGAPLAPG